MKMERLFLELQNRLDDARSADRRRFDATRCLKRESNRHLAHRFNVLDYLRTDELGELRNQHPGPSNRR